ncbi:sugar ABC transporter permease [Janibacter limosus]|uniref:sugar ABC transporter permease n=1 Tax=Janibacter limosus TaxID=53458 RepID=UPI0035DBAE4F|nr:sugar ABC transporter permease [Janibacter limosus]
MTTPSNDVESTSPVTPASTDAAALPADLQDERLISEHGISGWLSATGGRIRTGDPGSLPVVIGPVIIWIVFQSLNGNFLSSRNLVNLTLQSAAVGTISVGVVLVLLLGQIDLSIGSISGLSSAVLAVGFVNHGWSAPVAIIAALVTGLVIGPVYGAIFTTFGVPSFVITPAGLLGIPGLQLLVLGDEGTVNLPFDSGLVNFAQKTFLVPAASYALIAAVVAVYVAVRLRAGAQRKAAGLSAPSTTATIVRAVMLALILGVPAFVLNRDRGVPMMFLTFLAPVVVMDPALRRTSWGRAVMAVGGNVEAARRAGIRVTRVYLSVFALTATFAALGGVFAACRPAAANQSSGGADTNLNAIAAAVIGGTSLFGGRGSAYSALLGVIVIQSISSGLSLLNLDSSVRYMVTGGVLLLAVVIDSLSRRSRAAHGRA